MKFIAVAHTEAEGDNLALDIQVRGGIITKRYPLMPEMVVFEDEKKNDTYWLGEFTSKYLKKITRDERNFSVDNYVPFELNPLEKPIYQSDTFEAQNVVGWHLEAINCPKRGSSVNQRDVNVYVVDTGITPHSDLPEIKYLNSSYRDGNGHGTHVAGLVSSATYGVNSNPSWLNLYAVKVLDDNGGGTDSSIVEGLMDVFEHHMSTNEVSIVNMSLSGRGLIPSMPAYDVMVKMQKKGVMFVVAAGNKRRSLNDDGTNLNPLEGLDTFPAEVPGVLCVAASTAGTRTTTDYSTLYLASFSNYSGNCRVNAPGMRVKSTYLNNSYATMSGTSMASPVAAGALALRMSFVDKRPETAEETEGYINQFLEEFTVPKLEQFSGFRNHTSDCLDIGNIALAPTLPKPEPILVNIPGTPGYITDEPVPTPVEPEPEPEPTPVPTPEPVDPPKDKGKDKGSSKGIILVVAVVAAIALAVFMGTK